MFRYLLDQLTGFISEEEVKVPGSQRREEIERKQKELQDKCRESRKEKQDKSFKYIYLLQLLSEILLHISSQKVEN